MTHSPLRFSDAEKRCASFDVNVSQLERPAGVGFYFEGCSPSVVRRGWDGYGTERRIEARSRFGKKKQAKEGWFVGVRGRLLLGGLQRRNWILRGLLNGWDERSGAQQRVALANTRLQRCAVPGGSPGAAECRRPGRARTSRAGSLASFPPPGSQSSASRWWPSRPPPVAPAARRGFTHSQGRFTRSGKRENFQGRRIYFWLTANLILTTKGFPRLRGSSETP
eukprot:1190475-Prorocentrum_minimum.AAC.1